MTAPVTQNKHPNRDNLFHELYKVALGKDVDIFFFKFFKFIF